MQSLFRALLLLLVLLMATLWLLDPSRQLASRNVPPPSAAPTLAQVQSLQSLVTSKLEVCDIVESGLGGYVGSIRVALLVRGDVLHTVNLSRARYERLDVRGRTAVLSLPQPQCLGPRVDHQASRVFAVRQTGLWVLAPGDEAVTAAMNATLRDAQARIAHAGQDPAAIGRSRSHTEAVIRSFYRDLGWTVQFRWQPAEGGSTEPALPRPSIV